MLDNILIRFVFSARDAGGKGAVLSFWEVAVRCRAVGDLLIGCVSKAHSRLKARFKGGGAIFLGEHSLRSLAKPTRVLIAMTDQALCLCFLMRTHALLSICLLRCYQYADTALSMGPCCSGIGRWGSWIP